VSAENEIILVGVWDLSTMGKHGAQANVTFNMLNGIVSEDKA
jgi:hypothetical protein